MKKKIFLIGLFTFFLLLFLNCSETHATTLQGFFYEGNSYVANIDAELTNYVILYQNNKFILLDTTYEKGIFMAISPGGWINFWSENWNPRRQVSIYIYNFETNTFDFAGKSDSISTNDLTGKMKIQYISGNCDASIIDDREGKNGTGVIDKRPEFSISLSTAETTLDPITAYSNYFGIEFIQRYKVYISVDNEKYDLMHVQTMTDAFGDVHFRYYNLIEKNGVYYFRFEDTQTQTSKTLTYTILNITVDKVSFMYKGNKYTVPINFPVRHFSIIEQKGKICMLETGNQAIFMQVTGGVYYWSSKDFGARASITEYLYNFDTNSFDLVATKQQVSSILSRKGEMNLLYSTIPVYIIDGGTVNDDGTDANGTGTLGSSVVYSLSVSTTETTSNPITVYTNYFDLKDVQRYKVYISSDNIQYKLMHTETLTDASGKVYFRAYYPIFQNGLYYFKFIDTERNKTQILTLEVTNIQAQHEVDRTGIPFPQLSFYKTDNTFVIRTQSFTQEQIAKYQSYYSKNNIDDWNRMSIGTIDNTDLEQLEYFFYFTVPADSEDCTFFIRFYDASTGEYGSIASLDCRFSNMNDYINKVDPSITEGKETIESLKEYFSERFGFLTYPIEFITELINRIMNINYKEPVLHIPELRAPYRRLQNCRCCRL